MAAASLRSGSFLCPRVAAGPRGRGSTSNVIGSDAPQVLRAAPSSATQHRRRRLPLSRCEASRGETSSPAAQASLPRRVLLSSAAALAMGAMPTTPAEAEAPAADADALEKRKNLPIEELRDIIARDIRDGQYFVTGDLTRSIYRDDCRFKDPTNTTVGLDRYLAALAILFDPATSRHELVDVSVTSEGGSGNGRPAVVARWRLGGYLKFPWRPRVELFSGSTRYEVDGEGLVALHEEQWSISPLAALLETVTPTFGAQEKL